MRKLADIAACLFAQLKRPAAIAGAFFVAIAAALGANALYLQPRMHPSPLFATRLPDRAAEDAALVRAVQEALALSGRYSGSIDGISGPQTVAAIQSFEQEAGRAETGRASADLLAAIRSASAPTQTASVAPAPAPMPTPSEKIEAPPVDVAQKVETPDPIVAAVQNALALSAYGPLNADGIAGPDTRAAIMRFQEDHNLPATGEISDTLVIELRAAGAMHDG